MWKERVGSAELRAAAKAAYEKALELDPANEIVQNALRGLETEQPNPAAR